MRISKILSLREAKVIDILDRKKEYEFPYILKKFRFDGYYICDKKTGKKRFHVPIKNKEDLKDTIQRFLLGNVWFKKFEKKGRDRIVKRYFDNLKGYLE
jgi:hypothetical protein